MTGGSSPKKVTMPQESDPDPAPTPATVEEQIMAKDITKRRAKKKGRGSQILAGRLNRQVMNFGKSEVGE